MLDVKISKPTARKFRKPDLVFPQQESGMLLGCLFVMPDNPWQYKGPESFIGQKLGGGTGYDYGEYQNYIDANKKTNSVQLLAGAHVAERNLKKLFRGRIDVIAEEQSVLMYELKKLGKPGSVKSAGCPFEAPLYTGFSPRIPKAETYARILSEGIEELRKSGTLQKILARYGLKDWKEPR